MTKRGSQLTVLAIKRMVRLILLLALLMSQSVMYAAASPAAGEYDGDQADTSHHDHYCPMMVSLLPGGVSEDSCPDDVAMAHCSFATCFFHTGDGLVNAKLYGIPTAQNRAFKGDAAVLSRSPDPHERPPRIV